MNSEQMLCDKARGFEVTALGEMYDRYSPEIYRYAFRLLGDPETAEECVAETFSRLLKALKNGGGPKQHLRAYLFRTAHNWVTDLYRRKGSESLALDPEWPSDAACEPQHAFSEELERQAVRQALAQLTPDQRQVIVLRYLEEWEFPEISRALDKPVSAIKALQHRGLGSLRRQLYPKDVELI
jgi:RNA polymerase sigma-70 factor (ECF subfamily)